MLLLDRHDFPRDKACGDGIAPHVFDLLAEVGVTGIVDDWTPVRRFALTRGEVGVDREMARPNWVVPRTVFDQRLVEAAQAAGAQLVRRRVRGLEIAAAVGHGGRRARRPVRRRRRRCAFRRTAGARGEAGSGGAGDPRVCADAAGAGRESGDRVRSGAATVVRVVVRPWRRLVERRVRRTAGERPASPDPGRAARTPGRTAAGRDGWRGVVVGAPSAAVRLVLASGGGSGDARRRRCRADQPDDRRGHLLRRRDRSARRPCGRRCSAGGQFRCGYAVPPPDDSPARPGISGIPR